ncbi:putative (di)nucleoside polyphosphate hydrolase [Rhodoblastus acidophilus]|uniref:RNA pyrophosphohydrolase n=1 Tax=Rhodoblastus acidophilus TaxID=1074 RepID=UPI002224865B|nr:RNA pyrophosphohydrolase [Rhodoblastus acidophilus]MCW2283223.1 putative (di)nucleoside polyphosphate hydrolase [Rhodoblastus acidophilus]MCW2332083.1 putative (di)nucleoside polyphosphate hydrolase [Rhodoblastus acidophilus]
MDALTYRPCVGIMLLNAEGLVFVGRRKSKRGPDVHPMPYEWQMPQGGIDEGEAPYDAALRELREETNVRSAQLLAEAPNWLTYDLPTEIGKKSWRGRFRGQTQRWFALRFTGEDTEINIDAPDNGRHKAEFDAWRWERMDRLPELIVPFKREVYVQVCAHFAHLAGA